MVFSELGLSTEILRAVGDAGYTQPTPIQEQAIPLILQGRDILGCAQTGTGKTASFTLPMIDILAAGRARARMPRSLILEPTRELAAQVAENFELYGKHNKLNMALLIGGESFGDQVKKLDRGVDVLIATPGRMIDLFERGNILLSDIKIFVIDESDRMLDMGFIPDIERIVSLLPRIRQTLMFSATMPPEIRRLADSFLLNPKEVSVSPPASPALTVTQAIAIVYDEDKRKALRHLIRTEDVKNAFIFCNRKRDVAILHRSLERHGLNAGALHGDLPQSKRTETLEAFKQGKIDLLVCSDVAARGLDIADVSHVFNFDVPVSAEDYVHRIGRTGRAGRSGRAFTLATPDDGKTAAAIARLIKNEIPRILIDGIDNPEFDEEGGRGRRRKAVRPRGKEDAVAASPRSEHGRAEAGRSDRGRGERGRGDSSRAEPSRGDPGRSDPGHSDILRSEPGRSERGRGEPVRPDEVVRIEADRVDGGRGDRGRGETGRPGRGEPPRFAAEAPLRDQPRRRRRDDDDRDEPAVIGFGDHTPAFLLRPARPLRDRETYRDTEEVIEEAIDQETATDTAIDSGSDTAGDTAAGGG